MKKTYVVITGASSGIGAEFAKRLAREGYSIVLVARRRDRLEALSNMLEMTYSAKTVIIEEDLSTLEGCRDLMEKIKDLKVSVFINNAGFGECGYFPDTDLDKEMQLIDVNIKSLHYLTKQILRKMQKQGGGNILNVASSAGLFPAGPYMAAYYASKAYVTSLTRAIAAELKEHQSSIYIGCLCPGPVDTEFNDVANVNFALKGISAEYCANYAIDMMKKRKTVIVPKMSIKLATFAGKVLPSNVIIPITGRQQKKKLREGV